MDDGAGVSSASAKVSEIFMTAGVAFNKLGELTLQLNSAVEDGENYKWTDAEIDLLKSSIDRFTQDLSKISQVMKTRSVHEIRHRIKRKVTEDIGMAPPPYTPYGQQAQAKEAPATQKRGRPRGSGSGAARTSARQSGRKAPYEATGRTPSGSRGAGAIDYPEGAPLEQVEGDYSDGGGSFYSNNYDELDTFE